MGGYSIAPPASDREQMLQCNKKDTKRDRGGAADQRRKKAVYDLTQHREICRNEAVED
jgi:hypothetical protein